jgi:hypothetical protein
MFSDSMRAKVALNFQLCTNEQKCRTKFAGSILSPCPCTLSLGTLASDNFCTEQKNPCLYSQHPPRGAKRKTKESNKQTKVSDRKTKVSSKQTIAGDRKTKESNKQTKISSKYP